MEMLIHLKIILTSTTLTFLPLMEMEKMISSLLIPGRIYECTELIIYNRWGQVQFISTETTSDGMEEIVGGEQWSIFLYAQC